MTKYLTPALVYATASLAFTLLAACGGGGGSSADSAPPGDGTTLTKPATLSGVAAYGAPLAGAQLNVIDARGQAVGRTTTNTSDGGYTLTLSTTTPTLPLMLQAAGHDATGRPLLLHSALGTLAATAVVHLTPFTDAAVALTLGTDPARVFAQPASNAALLADLGKVGAAGEFVRTLVKANLGDAKVAATLDLFSASTFGADKTGIDLALESLNISTGTSSRGTEQLQLANKLGSALSEVTVDLATARTEIVKTSGSAPAGAITSTLKATTSPTGLMAKLAAIDNLPAAINSAIAEGGRGSATTALTASYVRHDGRTAAELAKLVAGWADKNMQMGRMQVTGCADVTIAASGCVRVAVAARLIDASGAQTGAFSDAVSLGTGTAASTWSLVGNGQVSEAAVQPLAWLALDATGTPPAALASNPRLGVQLAAGSGLASARALLPGGHVLALVPCDRPWLCVTVTSGATSTVATGALADHAVLQVSSAWLGTADTAVGAKYTFTLTPATGTVVTRPVLLRGAFVAVPAAGRFPVLDDVGATRTLASATLLAGRTLSWKTWAAANSDMRLLQVRVVLAGATEADPALVFNATPANWRSDTLDWPETTVPDTHAGSTVSAWLTAIDSAGRLHVTSYADLPVN